MAEPKEKAAAAKSAKPARRKRRWWVRALIGLTVLTVLLGAAAVIGVAVALDHYGKDLPDISWAEKYRPPIVSDVLSGDDQLLGEFYRERRRVVPYDRIPKKLVQAFVAAEDANFFDHSGIDFKGVIRAAFQNLISGRKKSGASTLTQQTAKAILISHWGPKRGSEKTARRKIGEAILARRLEQRFTKEEILNLYLNQVYLGHSSYGVQAAAENYFRKSVQDLTLGEMSLLAGLPQSPSRYSPFAHPKEAKDRRKYVLRRMLEEGMITQADHDAAAAEEVKVYSVEDFMRETAPFVTEHMRRDIVDRYGNERLLKDGLQIYGTVDLDLEREAAAAALKGIIQVDKRQGYRGPLTKLDPKTSSTPGSPAYSKAMNRKIAEFRRLERKRGAAPANADRLSETSTYVGVVIEESKDMLKVGVGDKIEGVLPLSQMKWARKPNPDVNVQYWGGIDSASKALAVGDVILVRALNAEEKKEHKDTDGSSRPVFALEQEPALQGALVSMDPKSGYIVAMIGGYDFNKSEFNRAFQSCRQPGSSFKPIVYSAAIEQQGFTPSTILQDAPIVYDDPNNQMRWKPSNFEPEFKGAVTVREALIHSMNIPAIRTLEKVGPSKAVEWAYRLGITDPRNKPFDGIHHALNADMSIALGSSCVTLWDLTQVYAVFNQGGKRVKPTFLRRVVDRDGHVLEDHSAYYDPWTSLRARLASGYATLFQERERVMKADTAFITTHLMQEVCRYGTAAHASSMGRNVAGKTGTTNDAFDAWFMGFSPELVTGVWVGYDTYEAPMGKYETGGHTALPIWMDYMSAALKGRPNREFTTPDHISWVAVDGHTGKRATSGGMLEPFASDNLPEASDANAAPTSAEFMHGND
jgi:penicillin-binding protein 1A